MDISIEFVFLFACALFVLHFIISEYGHTIEGYTCGTCPISTAKCPNKCKKIKPKHEWSCMKGDKYECSECGFATDTVPEEVCLDTGATENLYIGNLDLEIDGDIAAIKYKYNVDENKWYVYTWRWSDNGTSLLNRWRHSEVTNTDKLNTLKKLKSSPYYIYNIGLFHISGISLPVDWLDGGIIKQNTDLPFDYKIGVNNKWDTPARHYYFSDSARDVYCLGVPLLSVWGAAEFPHVVDYNSKKNKLQYIGYAPAMEIGGQVLTYC